MKVDIPWVEKDPQDKLDYGWNAEKWMDVGDSISASSWTVTGADAVLVVTTPAPTFGATETTVWLSGGTVGKTYKVTNHITTTEGRQIDRTFEVYIKNL